MMGGRANKAKEREYGAGESNSNRQRLVHLACGWHVGLTVNAV